MLTDMSKQTIAQHCRADSELSSLTERDLAQKALKDFNNCNYSSALNVLLKLEEFRPHDIKLQHNKAVCEFFKSGLTNVDAFHKALHNIIAQCSEGTCHGRGPEMPFSNESALSLLNLAVVYYHQLNYSVAIELLSPLYAAVESLDETVGMRVYLLLISSYLLSSNAEEAQKVIQSTRSILLPQPLPSTEDETPVSSPHHAPCPGESGNLTVSSSVSTAGGAVSDTNSGYNLGSADGCIEYSSSMRGSSSCRGTSIDQEALRLRLQMLSVRALLCLGQPRPAAKEMKAAIKHAANSGNQLELSQICLKSQVRFVQCQGVKAIKVLNTCTAIPQLGQQLPFLSPLRRELPTLDVWYNNNLALLYWSVDRPAAAYFQLEKAVSLFLSYQNNPASACLPSLYNNYATLNMTLCYNMGCARLHFNKSRSSVHEAFNLFLVTQQVYPKNPRIWVHLAECCIAVHQWRLKEESTRRKVGVRELGTGQRSKLLLCPPFERSSWAQHGEPLTDAAFPEPKLPFARLCLENALKLLPASNRVLDDMEKMRQMSPSEPSLPMRPEEVRRLRCVALCCAAYIDLCLECYGEAVQHATDLIAAAEASSASHFAAAAAHFRYLGHLYAAEACIHTTSCCSAVKHLEQALGCQTKGTSNTATLMDAFDEDYLEKNNIDPHQLVLKYNLCSVYAFKEDFEKARVALEHVWNSFKQVPARVVMLAIYLHLREGNIAGAQDLAVNHLLPLGPTLSSAL